MSKNHSDSELRIGDKIIGSASPPLIIAELSANHNGSLDRAIKLVEKAAECGAGAIKLQTFKPDTLTMDSYNKDFYIDDEKSLWHERRLWDLYEEAQTPWEWHEEIFKRARELGLAAISTAFDLTSVDFLRDIGVDAIKISSFELIHLPLIEYVAKTGLPMLVSTGMATLGEINDAYSIINKHNPKNSVLLKCTSAYPSIEMDANIVTISDMRERFGCLVGLSDHCLRQYAAFSAIALGAVVIEKHFTFDRSEGGLDADFSMEPDDLKFLAEGAALVWQSLGKVNYEAQGSESTSLKERPSIYATKDIKHGELFTEENIKIIRPGFGLRPKEYGSLLGKKSNTDIGKETAIEAKMVK